MNASFRSFLKSRAFRVIVWITVFALAVPGIVIVYLQEKYLNKNKRMDEIAIVDDYKIPVDEFQRTFVPIVNFIQEAKSRYGKNADLILKIWGIDSSKNPKDLALESLIEKKIIQKNVNSLGIEISKDYVEQKLLDASFMSGLVPQQLIQNGQVDTSLLMSFLERQNISAAEFETSIKEKLQEDLLKNFVKSSVYIPEYMIKEFYIKNFAKKKLAILELELQKYLDKVKTQKLSDQEISDYFAKHKENYKTPETRSAKLWTFSPSDYGITITDNEITKYYNKHKKDFITEPEELQIKKILIKTDTNTNTNTDANIKAQKKIDDIAEKLKKSPAMFEELAQKESQDSLKGKTITVKRGELNPLFEQASFALKSANDISPVIKTTEGLELIKLINKKAPKYSPIEKVKNEIANKLKQEKLKEKFEKDATRTISQTKDIPDIFDSYVKNKKAKSSILTDITLTNNSADNNAVSEAVFDLKKVGDKAPYFENNSGYIVELTDIKKSYIPEISVIKDKIIEDIYITKANKLLENDLITALESENKSLKDIAQKLNGSIEFTDWIDPTSQESLKVLNEKSIPVKVISSLSSLGERTKYIEDENSSKSSGYLVELSQIEDPKDIEKSIENKKSQIISQITQSEFNSIFSDLKKFWHSNAKIKINEEFLKRSNAKY